MSQLDLLKEQFAKALEKETVSITPPVAQNSTARWGYIDNDWKDDKDRLAVLFAAIEVELSDVKYHPEAEFSVRLQQRAADYLVQDRIEREMGTGHRFDERYVERTGYCELMHRSMLENGWAMTDLAVEKHGGGSTWVTRYSKISLDNPMYCWQVRIVYVPTDYSYDQEIIGKVYDRDGPEREYVVANYELGELTNVDTHDFATGALIKRIYVERHEQTMQLSPYITPDDDHGIYGIARLGIHTHRVEFIVGGERHTYNCSIENDNGEIAYRRIVVELYPQENTII